MLSGVQLARIDHRRVDPYLLLRDGHEERRRTVDLRWVRCDRRTFDAGDRYIRHQTTSQSAATVFESVRSIRTMLPVFVPPHGFGSVTASPSFSPRHTILARAASRLA